MTSGGEPVDFERADPETDQFGVGAVEHFSWKALLTSPPAPSAAAARTSVRPGTPPSRSRPSWSYSACATTRTPRPVPAAGGGRTPAGEEKATPTSWPVPPRPWPRRSGRWSAGRKRRGSSTRRAVGLHHLRRLRVEQCPVDIEHVDHRGPAPPPGDDRVPVPGRGRPAAAQPGATGQPLARRRRAAPTGPATWALRCRWWARPG